MATCPGPRSLSEFVFLRRIQAALDVDRKDARKDLKLNRSLSAAVAYLDTSLAGIMERVMDVPMWHTILARFASAAQKA